MNIDTAHFDRQDLINNLSGGSDAGEVSNNKCGVKKSGMGTDQSTNPSPAQTLPDTWEAIEAQLDHWAEMDQFYWIQRKEKEYAAWMERTYGV